MNMTWGGAVVVLGLLAVPASAQSLMEQAKGTWRTTTEGCGDQVMTITDVDAKTGLIKGTFYCGRMNLTVAFGEEAVPFKSMIGRIEGNKLDIKGANSYQKLTFDGGTKLTGPMAGGNFAETVATYQKK